MALNGEPRRHQFRSAQRHLALWVAIGFLWAGVVVGQDFVIPEPGAAAYGGYAVVAGVDVRIGSTTQVNGDVHADEDVDISSGGVVAGDVTAGGVVPSSSGVSGTVTEGATSLGLPTLPAPSEAEEMTKAVFKGDTEFPGDLEVKGILYIDGDAVFYGSVNGEGTIISSEDVRLEEAPGATLDAASRVSFIATGDIWIDRDREVRGLLSAGEDIKFKSGSVFEGVAIAVGVVDIDPDVTVTYLDPSP